METERFSVPELLFYPSDVGLRQAGLPEMTMQSLLQSNMASSMSPPSSVDAGEISMACADAAARLLVLTGGNTKFPNFAHRFERDIRPLFPDDIPLQVRIQALFLSPVFLGIYLIFRFFIRTQLTHMRGVAHSNTCKRLLRHNVCTLQPRLL